MLNNQYRAIARTVIHISDLLALVIKSGVQHITREIFVNATLNQNKNILISFSRIRKHRNDSILYVPYFCQSIFLLAMPADFCGIGERSLSPGQAFWVFRSGESSEGRRSQGPRVVRDTGR